MKWDVNSLAKELGFCFDQNNFEPPMYSLIKNNEYVFDSRSLEEINGFLLGFKYGFRYARWLLQPLAAKKFVAIVE